MSHSLVDVGRGRYYWGDKVSQGWWVTPDQGLNGVKTYLRCYLDPHLEVTQILHVSHKSIMCASYDYSIQ